MRRKPIAPSRVLVAPDAFKGTMSADEVARAIAAGMRRGGVLAEECPVADGGEGTMSVLLRALGGEAVEAPSTDPLGRAMRASWGLLDRRGEAIVESAQASGLALLRAEERDAELASSAGTGELIIAARDAGAKCVIVTIGGTAMTDGGAGALEAIEAAGGLDGVRLDVLCDVTIPFEQAAPMFAPQKGASPTGVARLARRLDDLARSWPRDPRGQAMTGAGGGLAGGLWARYGAVLHPGSDYVLDALRFDRRLARADAVVIGEGRLDDQSLVGKIGGTIANRARRRGLPVHAIVGSFLSGSADYAGLGLSSMMLAGTPPALERAGETLARSLVAGIAANN